MARGAIVKPNPLPARHSVVLYGRPEVGAGLEPVLVGDYNLLVMND